IRLVRGARGRSSDAAPEETAPEDVARDSIDTRAAALPAAAREPTTQIPAGMTEITSPMVGTFFRAPAPDAPPFVAPGDVVRPGQAVCIIEAMKMMNEV